MGHEQAVFEGRTLEDAVKKGLEAMGRSRAEVMITILEEGSGGFLGLGARPYKVRIMPRPGGAFREQEREREPGRAGGSRGGRGGRGRAESGRGEGGRGREGRERAEARPARAERGRRVSAEGPPPRRDRAARAPVEPGPAREAAAGTPRNEPAGDGGREERRREGRPMRAAPPAREHDRPPGRESGREPGRGLPREPRREPLPFEAERPLEAGPAQASGEATREGSLGPPSEGRRRRRGRRGRGAGGDRPMPGEASSGVAPRDEPAHEEGLHEGPMRAHAPEEAPPEFAGRGSEAGQRHIRATATLDEGPGMSPDELAATGKRLTEEFLAKLGFEATVTASAEEDHVDVTASVASNEELLTGAKGEVRQALQHLLNRMLNRGEGSRYHLQLEVNEFWKRREDELRDLARRLAEEALSGNTEAVTEYLNAQERRIVHVELKEDPRVKTYALGTGLIKRVAVAPADFPEGPRSD
jgi:predicted RNA-binding protein Jag